MTKTALVRTAEGAVKLRHACFATGGLMGDELSSRRRGMFPDTVPAEHIAEQVLVTVSLDADLYEWLQGFVGRSTFTSNVEETVSTALRCIRGDLDWRMLQ